MTLTTRIQRAFQAINRRAWLVVGAFFLIYLLIGVGFTAITACRGTSLSSAF